MADLRDTRHYEKAQPDAANPYRNLAFLPLRQLEHLLLAGFAIDERKMNQKQSRVSA